MKELIKIKVGDFRICTGIAFIYSIRKEDEDTCELILVNAKGNETLIVSESYDSNNSRLVALKNVCDSSVKSLVSFKFMFFSFSIN